MPFCVCARVCTRVHAFDSSVHIKGTEGKQGSRPGMCTSSDPLLSKLGTGLARNRVSTGSLLAEGTLP